MIKAEHQYGKTGPDTHLQCDVKSKIGGFREKQRGGGGRQTAHLFSSGERKMEGGIREGLILFVSLKG